MENRYEEMEFEQEEFEEDGMQTEDIYKVYIVMI